MKLTKFHRWLDQHETTKFVTALALGILPGLAIAFEQPVLTGVFMSICLYITITRVIYVNN